MTNQLQRNDLKLTHPRKVIKNTDLQNSSVYLEPAIAYQTEEPKWVNQNSNQFLSSKLTQVFSSSSQTRPSSPSQGLSLRTKVTALALAIGMLPTLTVGGALFLLAKHRETEQVNQVKIAEAAQVSERLTNFMAERLANITTFAEITSFVFDQVEEKSPSSTQWQTKAKPLFEEKLTQAIQNYPPFDDITLYDPDGNHIAHTRGVEPDINRADFSYFEQALETDKPVISEPIQASLDNADSLAVYLAAPVQKDTGETTAVIVARIPVNNIGREVLRRDSLSDDVTYQLIDSAGETFQNSHDWEHNPIGTPIADKLPLFPSVNANQVNQAWISKNAQLNAYSAMGEVAGLSWSVVASTDTEVAFAARSRLLTLIILGTGLAALLSAALAIYLGRRLIRPLLSAVEVTEKIGQGLLDSRLSINSKDELAILSTNINEMASQLQNFLEVRSYEAEQDRLLTLAKGSGPLRATDLRNIYDQAVEGARDLFNLDRVVIYRLDGGSNQGVISESVDPNFPSALKLNVSDSCIPEELREAYCQGCVVVINDTAQTRCHREHRRLLERLRVRASLVTPLVGGGQLFGLMIAHDCSAPRSWKETEIVYLRQLATELGLTTYRVELLEETTNLAAEQRQLKEKLQQSALTLIRDVDPIIKGDLTVQAKVTPDEIGTVAGSYNATVNSMRKIVTQVQATANQVAETTHSSEIAVQALSAEVSQQAEGIVTALKRIEEMAEVVQMLSANAVQAEAAVQQAAHTVEAGDTAMNRTVHGIQAIRATVAETAKKVKRLGESSQKISTVVDLISGFAEQTKMLSLNASIEAALAGEQGRGFAVVASEVRALAQRSAEATEEIKSLVIGIQTETTEVVEAMESGTEQVVIGTKLVDETRQSLNQITVASAKITNLVETISQTTAAQSATSDMVTQTMTDMAALANKTSAEANQVSSSFKQLREMAQTLQAGVSEFKVS
ncbi:MAG: methyl-accepting chemotaxis protein [Leptolyngbyaceae cyanobacterium MO_188.B28]|nr:methyl-accepting chemotaxis protein [Leptolyngbyaceae cyanobacterium MO_188.B28]